MRYIGMLLVSCLATLAVAASASAHSEWNGNVMFMKDRTGTSIQAYDGQKWDHCQDGSCGSIVRKKSKRGAYYTLKLLRTQKLTGASFGYASKDGKTFYSVNEWDGRKPIRRVITVNIDGTKTRMALSYISAMVFDSSRPVPNYEVDHCQDGSCGK